MTALQMKTIKGDWLIDGVIDNLNRRRELDVLVVKTQAWPRERGYPAERCSASYNYNDPPLSVTPDGDLAISGHVSFCPDPGELARIGIAA